jgi:hypothetical protein
MHDPFIVPVVFFIMAAVTAIGVPIARAFARRVEAGKPRVPTEVSARLERMEQAIDSIAVEIERISEGQRFTTKLLSERAAAGEPSAVPSRERQH